MAPRLRRRHHPIDGPWIIFEGGGKRTYRRRKTKADRFYDKSQKTLIEWSKAIIRKEIREAMSAADGALPIDLAEHHAGYKAWIDWARKQIDLDQNAEERK